MKLAKYPSWESEVDVAFNIFSKEPLALSLMCKDEGEDYFEPWCSVSVQIPGNLPAEGCVFVKNYSENEGLDKWLKENGFATFTGRYVGSGYARIPEMFLNMEKIKEYSIVEY